MGGIFEGGGDFIALGGVIVYEVGNFEDFAVGGFDKLKSRFGFCALSFAQFFDDVFDFADFVFGAFAGVDVGDVQNGFFFGV